MSLMIEAIMQGLMKEGSAVIILPAKKKKKTRQEEFSEEFEGLSKTTSQVPHEIIPSPA